MSSTADMITEIFEIKVLYYFNVFSVCFRLCLWPELHSEYRELNQLAIEDPGCRREIKISAEPATPAGASPRLEECFT